MSIRITHGRGMKKDAEYICYRPGAPRTSVRFEASNTAAAHFSGCSDFALLTRFFAHLGNGPNLWDSRLTRIFA